MELLIVLMTIVKKKTPFGMNWVTYFVSIHILHLRLLGLNTH